MTTIQDNLTYADGRPVNGQVVVSWLPYQLNGTSIAGGMEIFPITEGNVTIALYANATALPAGSYYTASYELEEGAIYTEYWIVPDLAQVSLGQVRVSFPPAPSVLISAQQLTSSGATYGQFLGWNGTHWVPMNVSTINLSPNTIGLALTDNPAADLTVAGSPAPLGQTMTLNVPDASSTGRGVVNTGAQTFAGLKTFSGGIVVTGTSTIAGYVPTTTQVNTGYGLTGGGALTGNLNLAVVDDSTVQRVAVLNNSVLAGTRPRVNFIAGANVTLTIADDPSLNSVDITITSVGGGTGPTLPAGATTGDTLVWETTPIPGFWSVLPRGSTGQILGVSGGTTTWVDASTVQTPWQTDVDAATYQLANVSKLGIAKTSPGYPLDVVGDVNITGVYRVSGVPLVTGVSSVFGRTGAVVAQSGDYTAAQVTNAVDSTGSYANPAWITSLPWSKITSAPGFLVDPTTTKGDVIVHGTTTTRLVVGTDGQVLTADSTQTLGIKWATPGVSSVFGRNGAVVAQPGDYTVAQVTGAVPNTVQVIAGAGMSGGGALTGNVTLSAVPMGASGTSHSAGIVPDPGATAGTTHYLREDATWAVPPGASQTPWTSNIDGGGYNLSNVAFITTSNLISQHDAATDAAVNQISARGVTNPNQQLLLGYNTTADHGVIQAIKQGTAYEPLLLNPLGANVGIGTASPGSPLDVQAAIGELSVTSTTGTNYARYKAVNTANVLQIGLDSNAGGTVMVGGLPNMGYISSQNAYPLVLATTNSPRLTILSGGNVGLGTTSPGYKLDVSGDANITGTYRVNGVAISTPWVTGSGLIYYTGGNVGIGTSSPGYALAVSGDVNVTGVYRVNGVPISTGFWVAGSSGAIYYNGGNVGIGTSSPSAMFHVVMPGATIGSAFDAPGNPEIAVRDTTVSSNLGLAVAAGTSSFLIGTIAKDGVIFSSAGGLALGTSGNVRIYITSAGYFGIGTTSSTHLLQLVSDDAAKPSTNTWTIVSDIRTKQNVQPFEGGLSVIQELRPIVAEYNGLAGTPASNRVVSFDPEELEKVIPNAVSRVRAKLHPEDGDETDIAGINTHEILFHLVLAIQQLDARLTGIESRSMLR